MSVTEHTPITQATGDGTTTVVAFDWPVLDAADMKVKVDGTELTLNSDFVVNGVGSLTGGNVSFTSAPANGASISLYRSSVLQRPADYQTAGDFRASVVNADFDRLWLVLMEMLKGSRGSTSTVRAPAGETLTELPPKAERLGKLLSFDATTGDAEVIVPAEGSAAAVLASLSATNGSTLIGHNSRQTVAQRLNRTRYLSSYADPTGVEAADTGLATALSELMRYGDLIIDGDFKLATGGTLTNLNNRAIGGKGQLRLVGAASSAMVLKMVGTCDDLLFEGITVVGEANSGYGQTGIGNFSGQTLSRIRYINVNARDLNVGLSFMGNGGSCDKWFSSGCIITNTVGTVSGSGYGFHIDNATNGVCLAVEVDNACRHSIYHGRGTNNKIVAPQITNHRAAVYDGTFKAAISISRSSSVQIIGGEVLDCYDGQLEIGADSISNPAGVDDIQIEGLKLTNRKNSVYGVQIGEQAVPASFATTNIELDLRITDNHVTVGAVPAIIINNVNGLNMAGTRIHRTGITGTTKLLALGNAPYISADSHCQDVTLKGMEFVAQGSTLTDVRAIDVDTDICGNTSRHEIGGNTYIGVTAPVYFNATLTNPNFRVGQLYGEGTYNPANLVDGAGVTTTVAVAGLQLGDRVTATFTQDLQGVLLTAWVSTAGTASIRFQNETGGAVDLPSGTIKVFGTRGEIQ